MKKVAAIIIVSMVLLGAGVVIIDQPKHGRLDANNMSMTYTPEPNYIGSDEFTFKCPDQVWNIPIELFVPDDPNAPATAYLDLRRYTGPRVVHDPDTAKYVWVELTANNTHKGDMNLDGLVDSNDVDLFVTALTDRKLYQKNYPKGYFDNADINSDGQVDSSDLDAFVALLGNPSLKQTILQRIGKPIVAQRIIKTKSPVPLATATMNSNQLKR